MTFNRPRTCRNCGATFEASPADTTVRCPDCRAGRKPAPASACVVCEGTREVTYGPSAVTGEFVTVPCHSCSPEARS